MRLTTDLVPSTSALLQSSGIPLALVVKPYGELPSGEEIPTSSFGKHAIVRCSFCRAYVNPFVTFKRNGTEWECNFCQSNNKTDSYYYSPTDEQGIRADMEERAELHSGSVDFIATDEYMSRPPMPPTFVFMFDVSQPAVESGYLRMAAETIKGIIEEDALPGGERTRVCFLAFDKQLHFFNLRSTNKQPQILSVADTSDIFLP